MYLIKNGIVHIGDGTVKEGFDVLVKGKKIKAVEKEINAPEAQVIDATNQHVLPGFIDPATAVGGAGIPSRYRDNDEKTDPVMPHMDMKYSIDPDEIDRQEFYRTGITSIALMPTNNNVIGGQMVVTKTTPMAYRDRIVKEQAALKGSVTSDVKGTYGEKNRLPMTKMGIFYLLQETLRKMRCKEEKMPGKDVLQKVFEKNTMPFFVGAASENEMDGLLHLMATEKAELTIIDGFCFHHCLKEMLAQKTGLILGNVNSGSQLAKHHMELEKLNELIANGNKVAITASNGGYAEGRETYLWNAIEVFRAGVPAEEVVRMMCEHPAKMLHLEDRIGLLKEGNDADIVLFSHHPVTSYEANVVRCMVEGKVIL